MTAEKHNEHNKQAEIQIRNAIKKYGWFVSLFEADTAVPSFAYTIGFGKITSILK